MGLLIDHTASRSMFGRKGRIPQVTAPTDERLLHSVAETLQLGRDLAVSLRAGDVLLLHGPLGAGKTVLARGLAEGLGTGVWRGSPTFALVNEYQTVPRLFHIDLYRLTDVEVEGLGLEDYAGAGGIMVCEWPERAEGYLRSLAAGRVLDVYLDHAGDESRRVLVTGGETRGQ
jgi:tRNA threonylcarbamoyladenosine biosynthesis protein TsaE